MGSLDNWEIAWQFKRIGDLLELKGENTHKVRAYHLGADVIRRLPVSAKDLGPGLLNFEGIGNALYNKVKEYYQFGSIKLLETLKKEYPPRIYELIDFPGLPGKAVKRLLEEFKVYDRATLIDFYRKGLLPTLISKGNNLEAKVERTIKEVGNGGLLLARDMQVVGELFKEYFSSFFAVSKVEIAGELRRGCARVGQIELVVETEQAEKVWEEYYKLSREEKQNSFSNTLEITWAQEIPVHIKLVPPEEFACALNYYTGSTNYLDALEKWAKKEGYKLDKSGLVEVKTEKPLPVKDELELYSLLHLEYIPPELREDTDAIKAAKSYSLPRLIEMTDLKGGIHLHSNYSDGEATIEELALGGIKKGWQYLILSDHSQSLKIARGLSPERLTEQSKEIDQVNSKVTGIRIIKGLEVDILKDGSLDMPDDILAELECVIASIHTGFDQSQEQLTQRIIKAMQNPHIDIIAHPTGRMLDRRPSYALDIKAVLAAASVTGTAIEINGSPNRLDLPDIYCREAGKMGISFSIGTDAHWVSAMDYDFWGVKVARRGWIKPEQVINCMDLNSLLAWLKTPKKQRKQISK